MVKKFENRTHIYLFNTLISTMDSFRTTTTRMMGYIPNAVTTLIKPIGVFLGTILSLAVCHWMLIQIYASYCAPSGWTGPLVAFISLGSPVCQFINHFQVGIASYYITIWAAAATGCLAWAASKLNTIPVTQTLGFPLGSSKQRSESNAGAA